MAVVLSVVCDRCHSEYRPERARSDGSARTRAAVHGWATAKPHGVTLDVCPACLQQQVPAQQQAADRVLVGAASAARSWAAPAAVVHHVVLDADVVVCRWCAEGEHQWCSGCECTAHS